MKRTARPERIPPGRTETARRAISAVLEGEPLTAKEISGFVHLPEKQVVEHLEHIRKTAARHGTALRTEPARCRGCGFVFRKRERLTKPGRCPVCRHESIEAPRFSVKRTSH
jgi:predicted Zn-ribbon and HTH transcriptional regulator